MKISTKVRSRERKKESLILNIFVQLPLGTKDCVTQRNALKSITWRNSSHLEFRSTKDAPRDSSEKSSEGFKNSKANTQEEGENDE
jgi:hypothetical protein